MKLPIHLPSQEIHQEMVEKKLWKTGGFGSVCNFSYCFHNKSISKIIKSYYITLFYLHYELHNVSLEVCLLFFSGF